MWWRDAVLYQIYVRSFRDTDGDGVGDLPGVIEKLDHLAWLGVDTLWLSPVHPSPNDDWGYDVADYYGVHPELGTPGDLERLIEQASDRGIRILLDLVPNHTSDRHEWFVDARSSRDAERRDWYVWADPAPDGGPPNNWASAFMGPSWSLDERSGQYYQHNFLPTQPDLNWWNPEVRAEFQAILRHWFDRGVAGFRIDVCHVLFHDPELRDNPPATDDDHWQTRLRGQRSVHNANLPEIHDVLRDWRAIARTYDAERLLLGETYFFELAKLVEYHGDDDQLHLAFNIPFVLARLERDEMRGVVSQIEALFPGHAWPVWTGSNHDAGRFPSRWAGGDERRIRLALVMLMTLRGTPVLYAGDEIGQPDTELTEDDLLDPVGKHFWPAYAGRDPGRTPVHWEPGPGAGFTSPDAEPWLPIGDNDACNVAAQREDPGSVLHLCRDLIALRRSRRDLQDGVYETLESPEGAWVYRRGSGTTVALNMSDSAMRLGLPGEILLATDRTTGGEDADGLQLGPWEAAVLSV